MTAFPGLRFPSYRNVSRNYLTLIISTGCRLDSSSGFILNLTFEKSIEAMSIHLMLEFHAVL